MSIRFRCKCGRRFKLADHLAGKRAKCPSCGVILIVPKPSAPHSPGKLSLEPEPDKAKPEQDDFDLDREPEKPEPERLELALDPEPEKPKPISESEIGGEGSTSISTGEIGGPETKPRAARPAKKGKSAPDTGKPTAGKEAAATKKCPKCGVAAAAGAVICVECGTKLDEAKKPAKKKPHKKAAAAVGQNPKWVKPAIAAGLLLILGVLGFLVWKLFFAGSEPPPPRTPNVARGRTPPGRPTGPKAPGKAKGKSKKGTAKAKSRRAPKVQAGWEGFPAPALVTRDELLAVGKALAKHQEDNGRPAGSPAEAGIADEQGSKYEFMGTDVAALEVFQPMAYAKATHRGRTQVLFSDGTVRPVSSDALASIKSAKTAAGWVKSMGDSLLTRVSPQLRVTNARHHSIAVFVDSRQLGAVPKAAMRSFPVSVAQHTVEFHAGAKKSDPITVACDNGIIYEYVFPRYRDLPLVPIRAYKAALSGNHPDYKVEREGRIITTLKAEHETVTFDAAGGRECLDLRAGTLKACIEREGFALEGLDGKPMRVSDIRRLEEGIIRYKDGQVVVRLRQTAVGTIVIRSTPNPDIAAAALVSRARQVSPKGRRRSDRERSRPEARAESGDELWQFFQAKSASPSGKAGTKPSPTSRRKDKGPRAAVEPAELKLVFPRTLYKPIADPDAFAASLEQSSAAVTQLLLAQAKSLRVEPTGKGGRRLGPEAHDRDEMEAGERGPLPDDRWREAEDARRGSRRRRDREKEYPPLDIRTLLSAGTTFGKAATPRHTFAALAFYGRPSAGDQLFALQQKFTADSIGYGEYLLALARCGHENAVVGLRTAANDAPVESAIALAAIHRPRAREALAEVVSKLSARELCEAVQAWPAFAGPTSRRAFVEAAVAHNTTVEKNVFAMNALLQLEPCALEHALLTRLKEKGKQEKEKASEKASRGAESRDRGAGPHGRDERPPHEETAAEMERGHEFEPGREGRAVAVGAYSGAPLSWVVLAHFKNTEAVRYLLTMLQKGDSREKLHALAALAETRDSSLTGPVAPLLSDSNTQVSRAAMKTLLAFGDRTALQALQAGMNPDLVISAVPRSAANLARHAGHEATADLLARMLDVAVGKKEGVAPATDEKRGRDRNKKGSRKSTKPNPKADRKSKTPEDPEKALPEMLLRALARLGTRTDAVDAAVENALKHGGAIVRAEAYKTKAALSRLAGRKPSVLRGLFKLPPTIALAGAPFPRREPGDEKAAAVALKDSAPAVRVAGLSLLRGADASVAIGPLRQALQDSKNRDVRAAALDIIPTLRGKDRELSQLVKQGLGDADIIVAAAAARAAVARKDRSVGEALARALGKQVGPGTAEVRAFIQVVDAVGMLRVQSAAGALTGLLEQDDINVRLAAVRALGRLESRSALQALSGARNDKEPKVATAALFALCNHDSPVAVQAVTAALQSDSIPGPVRGMALLQAMRHCAKPGPFMEWAEHGSTLEALALHVLVAVSASAPPDAQPGILRLASRHLRGEPGETRNLAAQAIARLKDSKNVFPILREAFERHRAGLARPLAMAVRRIRSPDRLPELRTLYKKLIAKQETEKPQKKPGKRSGEKGGKKSRGRDARARGPEGSRKAPDVDAMLARAAIIETVGNIGGEKAGDTLRRLYGYETYQPLKALIVKTLGKIESPTVVRYLADYLSRSGDYDPEAIEALSRAGHLDRERADAALRKVTINSAKPPRVSAAAADALDDIAARVAQN